MMFSSSCYFELSILILYFFLSSSLSYFYTLYFYATVCPPSGCLWNILFIYLFTETGSTVLAPFVAKDDLEVLLLPLHPQGIVAGAHHPWYWSSSPRASLCWTSILPTHLHPSLALSFLVLRHCRKMLHLKGFGKHRLKCSVLHSLCKWGSNGSIEECEVLVTLKQNFKKI